MLLVVSTWQRDKPDVGISVLSGQPPKLLAVSETPICSLYDKP